MFSRYNIRRFKKYIKQYFYRFIKGEYLYMYDGSDNIRVFQHGPQVFINFESNDVNKDKSAIALEINEALNLSKSLRQASIDANEVLKPRNLGPDRRKFNPVTE